MLGWVGCIINVEIESAKLVLSVVETYLFRNLETKKLVDFSKFWDYLTNCTSFDFSTQKKIKVGWQFFCISIVCKYEMVD